MNKNIDLNKGDCKKVCYVWSEELITESDRLPAIKERASLVHELIKCYGLLKHMTVVNSQEANEETIRQFHSNLYLDRLKFLNNVDDEYEISDVDIEFGIGYDCEMIPKLYDLVKVLAGSSVTAARALMLNVANIVINWCGGWHHAHRFEAAGFCYVNDIGVAIEKLKHKYHRILYVDLDIHHGNGVEEAYSISNRVFTLSFHRYEPCFYPGTGSIDDIGTLYGKGYTCNVPFKDGLSDKTLTYSFDSIFPLVMGHFKPDVIVVQCGADILSNDPLGEATTTCDGVCHCIKKIISYQLPVMLLGGGGYNPANAARLWTCITATVLNIELDNDIPDNEYFLKYAPTYQLCIEKCFKRDKNTREYIDECTDKIKNNLEKYLPLSS